MKIVKTAITCVKEKLKAPFGFKGGFLSELWQVAVKVETDRTYGIGVGVQSVLWSDASVFSENSEQSGNEYMYSISQKAVDMLIGREGKTPIDLIDDIYGELLVFARRTIRSDLRETFVRNALVCVDNALWQAYAREAKCENFVELVPQEYRRALCEKHKILCNIPLLSYGVDENGIKSLLDAGTALLKIKIGFDNGGAKSKSEMLEWDKNRLAQIHDIAKNYATEYTKSGNILYYLDANGRYDSVERVNELVAFAEKIGAKDRIVLLEEPFEEDNKLDVRKIPLRVTADESVHSLQDVEERIELGYSAIALKPIAKTLSETLKILNKAYEKGVTCFCADLTVNPLLVEWNKNIAARIATLPEMNVGILESNGKQNYTNWEEMRKYSASFGKSYSVENSGIYRLDDEFYNESGNIFKPSKYYEKLF